MEAYHAEPHRVRKRGVGGGGLRGEDGCMVSARFQGSRAAHEPSMVLWCCLQVMREKGKKNANSLYTDIADDPTLWPFYTAVQDQAIWQYLTETKAFLYYLDQGVLKLPTESSNNTKSEAVEHEADASGAPGSSSSTVGETLGGVLGRPAGGSAGGPTSGSAGRAQAVVTAAVEPEVEQPHWIDNLSGV